MFQKLQAKAQAALSSHGLRTSDGDDQAVDPTQSQAEGAQQSGGRHYAIDSITHTLKQLQTQYSPQVRPDARQLQMVITSQKGVVLDFDAVSRDSKSHSKELYLWGQDQVEDVKDVSDRVAYLNFVHGTLASELAKSLDTARASYKSLRNAETALHPRRAARSNMRAEIERIQAAGSTGKAPANGAERIAELQNQLSKADADDAPQEREIALLKRRALVESERKKWAAFREYGAKLALLADASEALLVELPEQEPQGAYAGAQNTARIRSQLQHAIDSYSPPPSQTNQFTTTQPTGSGVGVGAETRSFGETHKDELDSLPPTVTPTPRPASSSTGPGALAEQRFGSQSGTGAGAHPESTLIAGAVQPGADVTRSSTTATAGHAPTTPLNPTSLNHAPASIPANVTSPSVSSPLRDATATSDAPSSFGAPGSAISPSAGAAPVPISSAQNDTSHVTVAETGVPLTAGADGPGPRTGSLSRDQVPTTNTTNTTGGFAPPAGAPPAGASQTGFAPPAQGGNEQLPGFAGATHHESAEEEKAHLAREERERLLHGGSGSAGGQEHLSAEEEKARLEREERERVLRGQQGQGEGETGEEGKTVPPPYADF